MRSDEAQFPVKDVDLLYALRVEVIPKDGVRRCPVSDLDNFVKQSDAIQCALPLDQISALLLLNGQV
ncbi:hypothetical protein D3C72_2103810 [compost metagenome]